MLPHDVDRGPRLGGLEPGGGGVDARGVLAAAELVGAPHEVAALAAAHRGREIGLGALHLELVEEGGHPRRERGVGARLGVNWIAIHPYAGIRGDGTVGSSRIDGMYADTTWLTRPIAEAQRLVAGELPVNLVNPQALDAYRRRFG